MSETCLSHDQPYGHDIARLARSWIGTPYVHQAASQGAGTDCLGLVIGVWQSLGGQVPHLPSYTRDWSEARGQEQLWEAAISHMVSKPIADMRAGDVLLFRMREDAVAKHLGILIETGSAPRFVHAMSGHGVVECALSRPWARRVVACFAFPEFEKGN